MKSALAIVAGLLVGVLVAAGILAAFVFLGPDPVGLGPTAPSTAPPMLAPTSSPTLVPSAPVTPSASTPVVPVGPSAGASGALGSSDALGSPVAGSAAPGASFSSGPSATAIAVP